MRRFALASFAILALVGCRELPHSAAPGGGVPGTSRAAEVQRRAMTTLRPIPGQVGNGFAEVLYHTNGDLTCSIRANLDPTQEGQYEVWLLGGEDELVNIGALESPEKNGTYFLTFRKNIGDMQGYSSYDRVVITRSDTRILEGSLTMIKEE